MKTRRSEYIDAETIVGAVVRPTMPLMLIKSDGQLPRKEALPTG